MAYIRFNSGKFGNYGGLARYFGDGDDDEGKGFKKGTVKARPAFTDAVFRRPEVRAEGRGRPSPYGARYEQHDSSEPYKFPVPAMTAPGIVKTTVSASPASTNVLMPPAEIPQPALTAPGLVKRASSQPESTALAPSPESAASSAPISPEAAPQPAQQTTQTDPKTGQIVRILPMMPGMPGMMMPPGGPAMPPPNFMPRGGPILSPNVKSMLAKVGTALAAGLILL